MRVKDFDLGQTLECGQCFNFERISDNDYLVTAHGRLLHVKQEDDDVLFLNASDSDVKNIWVPYFDLERDYSVIKRKIAGADPRLEEIIREYYGIHILNQEFPETLISFIISQNKNIPQIKKTVRGICDAAGETAGYFEGREYRAFPDLKKLAAMTEQDFRDLKTGFRAPYIVNAVHMMLTGTCHPPQTQIPNDAVCVMQTADIPGKSVPQPAAGTRDTDDEVCMTARGTDPAENNPRPDAGTSETGPRKKRMLPYEKSLREMSYEEAKSSLTSIKGVGDKVANCVLLFSLGFRGAFPVDVWIKRIMEELYFGKDTPKKKIEGFAREKFGEWGGYAQQYLFIYARNKR